MPSPYPFFSFCLLSHLFGPRYLFPFTPYHCLSFPLHAFRSCIYPPITVVDISIVTLLASLRSKPAHRAYSPTASQPGQLSLVLNNLPASSVTHPQSLTRPFNLNLSFFPDPLPNLSPHPIIPRKHQLHNKDLSMASSASTSPAPQTTAALPPSIHLDSPPHSPSSSSATDIPMTSPPTSPGPQPHPVFAPRPMRIPQLFRSRPLVALEGSAGNQMRTPSPKQQRRSSSAASSMKGLALTDSKLVGGETSEVQLRLGDEGESSNIGSNEMQPMQLYRFVLLDVPWWISFAD